MRYYKNGSTVRFKARGLLDHGLTPKPGAEGSSPSAPAIKRDIHHFRWMFSFYRKDVKDSKPERALSVKQNSMDYCFVAKR